MKQIKPTKINRSHMARNLLRAYTKRKQNQMERVEKISKIREGLFKKKNNEGIQNPELSLKTLIELYKDDDFKQYFEQKSYIVTFNYNNRIKEQDYYLYEQLFEYVKKKLRQ